MIQKSFYKEPVDSLHVGTSLCRQLDPGITVVSIDDVASKCYAMPIKNDTALKETHVPTDEYIVTELLHHI